MIHSPLTLCCEPQQNSEYRIKRRRNGIEEIALLHSWLDFAGAGGARYFPADPADHSLCDHCRRMLFLRQSSDEPPSGIQPPVRTIHRGLADKAGDHCKEKSHIDFHPVALPCHLSLLHAKALAYDPSCIGWNRRDDSPAADENETFYLIYPPPTKISLNTSVGMTNSTTPM